MTSNGHTPGPWVGRLLSADPAARDHYLDAVRSAGGALAATVDHLRRAISVAGDLTVAAVDLAALTGTAPAATTDASASRWERQHIQVLAALDDEAAARAEVLLREHLIEYGCDPLPIVACRQRYAVAGSLRDLTGSSNSCRACRAL